MSNGIESLINDLKSCNLNNEFVEKTIVSDFKQLVKFYIEGECINQMDNIIFEPQPELELHQDIEKTLQYLSYGRGYLILNTEIEKELVKLGLWSVSTKLNLFHNQDIVETLVDYYMDLLQQSI
jgi:hypothetical protein